MLIPEIFVAPAIGGIFLLLSGLLAALFARRGARLGNRETRAPDVQEMWVQQEADRRMRQLVEDLWWNLRRAFQSYYRRVIATVNKLDLTEAQQAKFELTPAELRAIDATPPEEN